MVNLEALWRKAAALLQQAGIEAVSYTHLDVYKRQALRCASLCAAGMLAALLLEKSLPEDETLAQRLSVPGKTRAAALRGALATTAAIVLHNLPEGILTLFTNAADSALGPSLALALSLIHI